jgi:1-acyl-sn-glycerol-3-phosphate acyltransferase
LFIRIARLWMNIWLTLIGCPVTVKGKENFAPHTTYIVTCNHNSLMDVPLSSPFIPGPNKTIAKTSFANIPLFGFYYRKGSVLVDRKSELSRKESYRKMKQVLATGMHMCIYPEGTRNKTKEVIGPFHNGAFRLAVDTKNAILPGIILNTSKAMPNKKVFYLLPHKLQIHFLPPIPVGENESADQLKEKTHEIMKAYILDQS